LCESISLTGVRVVNGEANRHATNPRACGEDPPFVMATVVTVEHHAPGLASGHHDDLILEQHRHSKRADVERLRRSKVGDEQDQALKVLDSHGINLARANIA